jgi:hypothetical protein
MAREEGSMVNDEAKAFKNRFMLGLVVGLLAIRLSFYISPWLALALILLGMLGVVFALVRMVKLVHPNCEMCRAVVGPIRHTWTIGGVDQIVCSNCDEILHRRQLAARGAEASRGSDEQVTS